MTMSADGAHGNEAVLTLDAPIAPHVSLASADDYYRLLKPRVMSLVIFTALVGMMFSPVHVNPVIGFAALLAIAIGAGASGCLNMWYDADLDLLMTRTATRPIPAGRVTGGEALAFGITLSFGSVLFLGLITNWQAAAFLAFTIFFYAVVYTMWLKRTTSQNIVIGGAAGAFPPMIGYMAATGTVDLSSFLLFAIIFIWTPPHFWALAIVKKAVYARAGVPMLPVVAGDDATRLQIFIYTLILAPAGIAPFVFGYAGYFYLAVATLSGLAMLYYAWGVFKKREGDAARKAAMSLFGVSILYLFIVFAALLIERIALNQFGLQVI